MSGINPNKRPSEEALLPSTRRTRNETLLDELTSLETLFNNLARIQNPYDGNLDGDQRAYHLIERVESLRTQNLSPPPAQSISRTCNVRLINRIDNLFQRIIARSLVEAAIEGRGDIIRTLLAIGNITDDYRGDAFDLAACHGRHELVRLLLESGNIADEYKVRAFQNAFSQERLELVRVLLESGNFTYRHRVSAIQIAVENGRHELVRVLLESGNITDEDRGRAVGLAARNGHLEVVRLLLASGNIPNLERRFAVGLAARNGHLRVVRLLEGRNEHASQVYTFPSLDEVRSNPIIFLNRIADEGFPSEVKIVGSRVVDAGGVRKQFLTMLCEALDDRLHLPDSRIPLIESGTDASAIEMYRNLGRFFSRIREANTGRPHDPFLTGSLFNPRFFEILQQCLTEQNPEALKARVIRIMQEIDPSELRDAAIALLKNPANDTAKDTFATKYGCSLEESTQNAGEYYEGYLSLIDQHLSAARCFLEGCDDRLKHAIRTQTYERVSEMLQGQEVTIEGLQRALIVRGAEEGVFAQQISWLKEAIANSDLAFRKAFVQWATGRSLLAATTQIRLSSTRTRDLCPHTCFNHIELPRDVTTKEEFLFSLKHQLEGFGFTVA